MRPIFLGRKPVIVEGGVAVVVGLALSFALVVIGIAHLIVRNGICG
jgi:hypothetical protein